MHRILLLLCVGFIFIAGLSRLSSAAQGRYFGLQKTSTYADGCFAPCMCPVFIRGDMRGRFALNPVGTQDGYDLFEVKNAQWFVALDDGSTIMIQGSGTYRSSTIYKLQRLEMDLIVQDRAVEHYDSGLVPIRVPFPDISITISKNKQYCRDTVFGIDAAPIPTDIRPPRLQFEDEDGAKGAATTWGRLKRLWTP